MDPRRGGAPATRGGTTVTAGTPYYESCVMATDCRRRDQLEPALKVRPTNGRLDLRLKTLEGGKTVVAMIPAYRLASETQSGSAVT